MKDAKIQWMIVLTLLTVCLGACKDRDTHYEYYDKDGSKPFKVFEVDRATGKMDGSFKQFNRMGILVKEGTYENGLKNGVFKEYSKNGSLVKECSYKKDLKNGTFKDYNENGSLVREMNYENDLKNGAFKEVLENGTLVETTYKNEFPDGFVKVYRGGKLVSKGKIEDGQYVHTQFFTDSRDGQKYPIVVIGSRVWMAANLNYKTAESHCYDDDADNCKIYGRLYSWKDALDACPEGWDIPNYSEWLALNKYVGDSDEMLKSASGWRDSQFGIDAFGFSALPAGMGFYNTPRYIDGKLMAEGRKIYKEEYMHAYFWSSSQSEETHVSGGKWQNKVYVEDVNIASLDPRSKEMWFSVRCIKDE